MENHKKEQKKKEAKKEYYDPELFLKQNGHENLISKLREHNLDPEIFWNLSEDELKDLFEELKVFGIRKKFIENKNKICKKQDEDAKEQEL